MTDLKAYLNSIKNVKNRNWKKKKNQQQQQLNYLDISNLLPLISRYLNCVLLLLVFWMFGCTEGVLEF